MTIFRSRTTAWAAFGCLSIVAQAVLHLTYWVSYPADLDGDSVISTLSETLVGAFVLALHALVFFAYDEFSGPVKPTAFLYPLFLILGFWQFNTINDGFGYMLLAFTVLMPIAATYAFLLWLFAKEADAAALKRIKRLRWLALAVAALIAFFLIASAELRVAELKVLGAEEFVISGARHEAYFPLIGGLVGALAVLCTGKAIRIMLGSESFTQHKRLLA